MYSSSTVGIIHVGTKNIYNWLSDGVQITQRVYLRLAESLLSEKWDLFLFATKERVVFEGDLTFDLLEIPNNVT